MLRAQQGHVDGIWKTIRARRRTREVKSECERERGNDGRGRSMVKLAPRLNSGWSLEECDHGEIKRLPMACFNILRCTMSANAVKHDTSHFYLSHCHVFIWRKETGCEYWKSSSQENQIFS